MRVNPDLRTNLLAALRATEEQQQRALEQLSSGRRVNRPSDDPSAYAGLLLNTGRAAEIDQYRRNISDVQSLMKTVDSALSSVVTSLTRAVSLGVQAGDATLSDANREQIAEDLEGVLSGVLQAANTSYNGVYVFAGTASDRPPFASNGTYQGNAGRNSVAIAEGREVATNIPGDELFSSASASVIGSLQTLIAAVRSGSSSSISTASASVRSALDYVSQRRVFYGNTSNQLDGADTFLANDKLTLSSQLNDLVGGDLSEVITSFTSAKTAHDAVLTAGSKVLQTSLLDYLK